MAPDPKKTQAVREWPTPGSVKAVCQFLGLASYYKRYIKNFANIAGPPYQLTQKSVQFSWNQQHEQTFSTLKHAMFITITNSYLP